MSAIRIGMLQDSHRELGYAIDDLEAIDHPAKFELEALESARAMQRAIEFRIAVLGTFMKYGSLETVTMCEKALDDFVETVARNWAISLKPYEPTESEPYEPTESEPYEPTESERYIYRILREQLEAAKRENMEMIRRQKRP